MLACAHRPSWMASGAEDLCGKIALAGVYIDLFFFGCPLLLLPSFSTRDISTTARPALSQIRILALLEESFPTLFFVLPSLLSFRRYRPLTGERPCRTNFGISWDWRRARPLFTGTPLSSSLLSCFAHISPNHAPNLSNFWEPTLLDETYRRIPKTRRSRASFSSYYIFRAHTGWRYSVAHICFVSPPALSTLGLCIVLGESYLAVYTAIRYAQPFLRYSRFCARAPQQPP
ncbi:hypothetical protein EDC04DRAFT_1561133 [Pisolithus marmoratus]|nr:hypothetical protein EDC04DRAFT_1561133 [Pisolithus marmoratus]